MIQPAKDLVVLNEYVKFKIGEMQARISMPQNDEFDIKMEVGKKEDLKVKCWLIFVFSFYMSTQH